VPIRFRDSTAGTRPDAGTILLTLRDHGAQVSDTPAHRVYELYFDTLDAQRLRRRVTDALSRRCPGWQHVATIFWPE
jgi:hypothetical protein